MPKPRASRKRENQQINRAAIAGHPRLCPVCNRMAATSHGRFNRHGLSGPGYFTECKGSGEKVPK